MRLSLNVRNRAHFAGVDGAHELRTLLAKRALHHEVLMLSLNYVYCVDAEEHLGLGKPVAKELVDRNL